MSDREHRISKSMPIGATADIPNSNGGVDRVTVNFSLKALMGWLVVLALVGGGGAGIGSVASGVFNPTTAEVAPADIHKAVADVHEEVGQKNAEAIRNVQTEQRIQGIQIEIIEEDVSEIKTTGKEMHRTLDEVLIEVKAAARARERN